MRLPAYGATSRAPKAAAGLPQQRPRGAPDALDAETQAAIIARRAEVERDPRGRLLLVVTKDGVPPKTNHLLGLTTLVPLPEQPADALARAIHETACGRGLGPNPAPKVRVAVVAESDELGAARAEVAAELAKLVRGAEAPRRRTARPSVRPGRHGRGRCPRAFGPLGRWVVGWVGVASGPARSDNVRALTAAGSRNRPPAGRTADQGSVADIADCRSAPNSGFLRGHRDSLRSSHLTKDRG